MASDNITFLAAAVFVEKLNFVRFAGRYVDDLQRERLAICRVTRDFLVSYCKMDDPSPTELLNAYEAVANVVHDIAARQLVAGVSKPLIDSSFLAGS